MHTLGRKEIVMFFYLYMLSVFLELLLITDIIPTSNTAYTVRRTCVLLWSLRSTNDSIKVFCSHSSRCSKRSILVSLIERLCWIPIRRRWHAHLAMGKYQATLMPASTFIYLYSRFDWALSLLDWLWEWLHCARSSIWDHFHTTAQVHYGHSCLSSMVRRSWFTLCHKSFLSSIRLTIFGHWVTSFLALPSFWSAKCWCMCFQCWFATKSNTMWMACSLAPFVHCYQSWWYTSIGIRSPRKILNFQLDPSKMCGKSRNCWVNKMNYRPNIAIVTVVVLIQPWHNKQVLIVISNTIHIMIILIKRRILFHNVNATLLKEPCDMKTMYYCTQRRRRSMQYVLRGGGVVMMW